MAWEFRKGNPIARNIVQWEKKCVSLKIISERKERKDFDPQMYNGDLNNTMRDFV